MIGRMRGYLLALLLPTILWAGSIDYRVHFSGVDDPETLEAVKDAAFLTTLKKKKPVSVNALRYRAESDIPDILKAMSAQGYYDATADVQIAQQSDGVVDVFVTIQPGAVYTIRSFDVSVTSNGNPLVCQSLDPTALGITLNAPAIAVQIIDAELKALTLLSECGHPLSSITDRQIVADYKTKTVTVHLFIEAGEQARFGPTTIYGAPRVKKKLFENKMSWKESEVYDTKLVDSTQKKLIDTGLFSSVIVSHDTAMNSQKELPMRIEATETKHKSINLGASYQTFFGPGLTFGWENRNVSGMGRTLSLKGDVTARNHTGTATFFVPDWWKVDQDYVFQAQILQESVYTYHEHSYSLTQRIERRIGTRYRVSIGLELERLLVTNSVQNGTFSLLEVPLYFRFSSASNLLDPTAGTTLVVQLTPGVNFSDLNQYYLDTYVSYAFYKQVTRTNFFVLASLISAEMIWSDHLGAVPVPKRVLGGTDEDLRGYRFKTVSPLDGHKPIGGRFGLFYTLEGRFRISRTIGIVPFFDLGQVELSSFPKWDEKWYKSVGIGFRYFTFLGPIRFDVAFPLDRRKHIDSLYRILVSIGQTF
jgi:translocation and assembly module TamA